MAEFTFKHLPEHEQAAFRAAMERIKSLPPVTAEGLMAANDGDTAALAAWHDHMDAMTAFRELCARLEREYAPKGEA